MLNCPYLGWIHGITCVETFAIGHQAHDVDELKQRLTMVWHGLEHCRQWRNRWVEQTSLGVCSC